VTTITHNIAAIQKGEVTHIQAQAMWPVSFNVIKMIPKIDASVKMFIRMLFFEGLSFKFF